MAEKPVERFDPDGGKQPEGEWIPASDVILQRARVLGRDSNRQDGSRDLGMVAKAAVASERKSVWGFRLRRCNSRCASNTSMRVVR
jgi:hypothetical protein